MIAVLIALVAFGLGAAIAWVSAKALRHDLSERRVKVLDEEGKVEAREREAAERLAKAQERLDEATRSLEAVAGLSRDEARAQLLASVEGEVRERLRGEEKRLEAESRERAARVLADAMQRQVRAYVTQGAIVQVRLPTDDMKGRIIGREGRNVRAFETATGADIVIDEAPGVVGISAFNPFRRTVAATALERLIADGRIHPARIEEIVEETRKELDDGLEARGLDACRDAGVGAPVRSELAVLLGRLHFHDAGGQSMLAHAIETAQIAGTLARELGLSAEIIERAQRAGLLHDVGKAVPDMTATHADSGADAAIRYGEHKDVAQAIREHHANEPSTLLGVLTHAANTLSKARPGARRAAVEAVNARVANLEAAAGAIEGVAKAIAVQAGSEIRVFVDPTRIDDQNLDSVARDVAAEVAKHATPKSAITVTVIRESRASATAKL